MVGAESTNQQEATDGECLTRARADQAGPAGSLAGADGAGRLPGRGAPVAGAEAGAGRDAPPVRPAGPAPQHGDPGPAAPGPDAGGQRGRLLPGPGAAAGGGAAVALAVLGRVDPGRPRRGGRRGRRGVVRAPDAAAGTAPARSRPT